MRSTFSFPTFLKSLQYHTRQKEEEEFVSPWVLQSQLLPPSTIALYCPPAPTSRHPQVLQGWPSLPSSPQLCTQCQALPQEPPSGAFIHTVGDKNFRACEVV